MNAVKINKILGAVLGTCLVLQVVRLAVGAIFAPPVPTKPGQEAQPAQHAAAKPAEQGIEALLATASPERGAQVAKQCAICHNLQEGQGPKVGPDLYGVVGRPVASMPNFHYSAPLKAKGGTWTFDALNTWLIDPRADVPGTAMTFPGISNEKQRTDVIAYLNTLSAHPLPLPTDKSAGAPAAAGAGAKPAAAAESQPASTAPAQQSFEALVANASAEHGAKVAKQCMICHNLQEGQGPKVGPDLYGVVGRPVASMPNFHYSAALKAKGGSWTFDALNKWLTDPRADVPGTAMTFAGISNEKQRAEVVAYLNTLSAHPLEAKPAAAPAQPSAQAPTPKAQ